MIGKVLGGRYEILARVGGGGMALVYKAHDNLLNRKVAIKVLRQQYVFDEDFIRRFGREAQSAAALSHPNVVSIYDVGQEGDIHFIVMEYIEGINLNEKIKEQAPLQADEAIRIASQICDALDHAHHNHIIHRDIKPHNILIGKNGRVKVTDFGIARAATSSDLTQTGSVIGSVHYFSPEHAKGVSQGEKSDLYSLGIVLYQMLTGRLPFLGESPISVALKHLQEEVEEPRKVNPLIPQSVENIILKAMQKRPEDRYTSAKEMLHDLETCLLPEKRNEPKMSFSSFGNHGDEDDDEEKTRVVPAIRPDRSGRNSIEDRVGLHSNHELEERPKKGWLKPLIWAVVVILILLLMWFGVSYVKDKLKVPDVAVPNVVNLPLDQAVDKLEAAQLIADPIEYVFDEQIPKDIVIEQEKADMKVKIHSHVKLTVSKGVETAIMPELVGMQFELAEAELKKTISQEIKKKEINSDEAAGTIIEQSPGPNEEYDPKKVTVILTVSKGKSSFEMPNLIGMKENEAISLATKHDLVVDAKNVLYEPSYTPKGYVFKQWPFEPGDLVEAGEELTLYVSSGYPEDAIEAVKNIEVSPTAAGVKTTVRIMISDARGENRDWGTKEITETMNYPVTVVVSSKTEAVISVYSNEQLVDNITVTYIDAQKQQQPFSVNEDSEVDTTPDESTAPDQKTETN